MNEFATVLKVVICFIILTDLTRVLLSFVWLKFSSFGWDHDGWRNKEWKEPKLGDSPERHPLFLLTIIGNFTWSYIFIRHMICVNLGASCAFSFSFSNAPCWYEIVLGWFIEFSLHFTYIFWVWLYRMLHVLHIYHLKFGLPVSLHI